MPWPIPAYAMKNPVLKALWLHRGPRWAFILLLLLIVGAVLADGIAPYPPDELVTMQAEPPGISHLFGTDDLGRDVLSRALHGARISLTVGFVAVAIALCIGTIYGSLAGYFGGILDTVLMRFVDIMLAFPSIFLILTIQAMLTPNIYNVMIVIGATSWMGVARLVRAEFLSIKERPYVEAARAIGASHGRIIFRHILPNAVHPILVAGTLGMAGAILIESSLSFLGMGVQPPMASWGNMLEDAQAYMREAWWMAVIPGVLITITVLALYTLGEGLREAFSPSGRTD